MDHPLSCRACLLVTALIAVLPAADGPHVVPAAVAEVLGRAAQAEPAEVVKLVDAYHGPVHPLLVLALAQAHWRLGHDAAESGFREALRLDAGLRPAHLGLAQCAARREDWATAVSEAAAGIDLATADRAQLTFLASTAWRAGDARLATVAAQQGILRFPDDAGLRRIELALLEQAGRGEDARQAALALLARTPADRELWRHLAWAAHASGHPDEALAALEAGLVLDPSDRAWRRRLAEAQLAQALPQAALTTVRPLLAEPATAEVGLVQLAVRCAADAGDIAQARTWIAAVPEATRSRELRLQAARLAVQANDLAAAGSALDALVALGERDAGILTWAASLAEQRQEPARAEALYRQAIAAEGSASASLRLVAMYLAQQRREEAATVLASHLLRHPDDQQARALQARLGSQ